MKAHQPFPIDRLPPRARSAILEEFDGRCPSIGEVASVPDAEWLKLPGIGPAVLMTMHRIRYQVSQGASARTRRTDAELLAERDRLQGETSSLRAALHFHEHQLRTITAELRARNLLSHQEKLQRDLPPYASMT